jgi:CRP-like cAMP-binding protein
MLTGDIEMSAADIEAIPLFAGLTPEEKARVAAQARGLHFEAGHVVVNEGEFAFDFYAIREGAAEVRQGDHQLGTLGPGDVFGELGVVRTDSARWTRRRTATVVVTAPTEAIAIDGHDLRQLVEEIPALREAISAAAAKRD